MQSPSRLRITFLMNASTCLITLPSMHTIPPYYEVSSVDTAAQFCVSVVTWVVRCWKIFPEETVHPCGFSKPNWMQP